MERRRTMRTGDMEKLINFLLVNEKRERKFADAINVAFTFVGYFSLNKLKMMYNAIYFLFAPLNVPAFVPPQLQYSS